MTFDTIESGGDWTSFTRTDATRFTTAAVVPTYLGSYGLFNGLSGTATTELDQSARMSAAGWSGTPTTACARFAMYIDQVSLVGANTVITDIAKHRDLIVWSKFKNNSGGSIGAVFKLVAVPTSSGPIMAIAHVEDVDDATPSHPFARVPTNGFLLSPYMKKWLGIEWLVNIKRFGSGAQNGIRVEARLWLLEHRRPVLLEAGLVIEYDVGDAVLWTAAHSVEDIVIGGRRLRGDGTNRDTVDIRYDEFRGDRWDTAFPRRLYGFGDFRSAIYIDKYTPASGVQDFAHSWVVPMEQVSECELSYREHGFETDLSLTINDPQTVGLTTTGTDATVDYVARAKAFAGHQYRIEVLATNATDSIPAAQFDANWEPEVGDVWWSGIIDSLTFDENQGHRQIRIKAYGISEMLKRTRSQYLRSNELALDTYLGANTGFLTYDRSIDLRDSTQENSNVAMPYEVYGEQYSQIAENVGRLLGSFDVGIQTGPRHNHTVGGDPKVDYRDVFLESKDDADPSSKAESIVRTVSREGPKVTQFTVERSDNDFANRWRFEGAGLVGEIETVVTARARENAANGFTAGFEVANTLDGATQWEYISRELPTTGELIYPFSMVGWQCVIIDRRDRVGFVNPATGAFTYEGGSRKLPKGLRDLSENEIMFWHDPAANRIQFQTFKNFPGSTNTAAAKEAIDVTSEGIYIALRPNGRTVERIVSNTKLVTSLGTRLKFIQSGDVIGWLQAGIAAQYDHFGQARASYQATVEEFDVRERIALGTNRIAMTEQGIQPTVLGASGDNYTVGSDSTRRVGGARLLSVKSLKLRLTKSGFIATWNLGAATPSVQDVFARFAKEQQG